MSHRFMRAFFLIDDASKAQGESKKACLICRAAALTRSALFLKCTAKVQNKILPTKRFFDLVLFVNKYYLYQRPYN